MELFLKNKEIGIPVEKFLSREVKVELIIYNMIKEDLYV